MQRTANPCMPVRFRPRPPSFVMIINLTISDFRNHCSCRISTHGRQNVIITGPNGAGKTAILEAVSMLGGDKGLRGAQMSEIANFKGQGDFSIFANLSDDTDISVFFNNGDSNRRAKIDGETATLGDLAKHLRIVWITPKEDRVFVDGATERRAFFDRMVASFDSSHSGRISKLSKLLSERAFVIKNTGNGNWLDALDQQIAGTSIAIASARVQYAGEINYFLKNCAISVSGIVENMIIAGDTAGEAERKYLAYLIKNRELAGDKMVLDGPHKSDFGVFNNLLNLPVNLTSTGQQKTALLDLVLAHAKLIRTKTGYKPLILLDEAAAHLDSSARQKLFAELGQAEAQVWATGLEQEVFKDVPNAVFVSCVDGEINNILVSEN